MKHLKKFENFDLGHRFSEEEDNEMEFNNMDSLDDCEECEDDSMDFESDFESEDDSMDFKSEDDYGFEQGFDDESEDEEEKDWNDEEELRMERVSSFRSFNEKKMNPGFKAYLDKQKAKKSGKDDKKGGKKDKPDFLDIDKDGNKKESMKKAAKDAKEDDKGKKGLTAGQKKLPKAMQDAILKKEKINEEFIMVDTDSSTLIKKIKKLKCMGTNAECIGYDDAKKEIIELIEKEKLK